MVTCVLRFSVETDLVMMTDREKSTYMRIDYGDLPLDQVRINISHPRSVKMTSDNSSRRPAPATKPLSELLDELLVNRDEQDKFSPNQHDTLAKADKRQANQANEQSK